MNSGEYLPRSPQELAYFDALWNAANPGGVGDLTGATAVDFFRKSGVDIGILKSIWSLSTPLATMNQKQFYTALRYIVMAQNGDFPISREKLQSSADVQFPPPRFSGVQINPIVPQSTAQNVPPPYALSSEDHVKYHQLFLSYDNDKDGFLTGPEAVEVFNKSGLDVGVLRNIWSLADDDKDNKLNSKEFCVGFHLIICISKKNLPLPTTLPPPLKWFLANAPATPPTQTVGLSTTSINPQPVLQAAHIPKPVPVQEVKLTVDAAFADLDEVKPSRSESTIGSTVPPSNVTTAWSTSTMGSAVSQSNAPSGLSASDEEDLVSSVNIVRDIAKRAVAISDSTVDSNYSISSTLKAMLQKMNQEKISLKAAVANAEQSSSDSAAKLQSMMLELSNLQGELQSLREQLDQVRRQNLGSQDQMPRLVAARQDLLREIETLRKQITDISKESITLSSEVSSIENAAGQAIGQSARLSLEVEAKRNEINASSAELDVLRAILNSLREEHASAMKNLNDLRSKRAESQTRLKLAEANQHELEREVNSLTMKKEKLTEERQSIFETLSTSSLTNVKSSFPSQKDPFADALEDKYQFDTNDFSATSVDPFSTSFDSSVPVARTFPTATTFDDDSSATNAFPETTVDPFATPFDSSVSDSRLFASSSAFDDKSSDGFEGAGDTGPDPVDQCNSFGNPNDGFQSFDDNSDPFASNSANDGFEGFGADDESSATKSSFEFSNNVKKVDGADDPFDGAASSNDDPFRNYSGSTKQEQSFGDDPFFSDSFSSEDQQLKSTAAVPSFEMSFGVSDEKGFTAFDDHSGSQMPPGDDPFGGVAVSKDFDPFGADFSSANSGGGFDAF